MPEIKKIGTIKRKFLSFLGGISLLCFSCMPEDNLPIRAVGETPGYFIECYCQPNEIFLLTASQVLPISQELKLTLSSDLQIHIQAGELFRLYPVYYISPQSGFVYNYAANRKLNRTESDTLYLSILTPENKTITAQTSVPDEVKIQTYEIKEQEVTIRFYTSPDPTQNYYIYTVETYSKELLLARSTCLLENLPHIPYEQTEKTLSFTPHESIEKIIINLKHITKANYDYQVSLNRANAANQGSISTPFPLNGNLSGALGIFTCYTEDSRIVRMPLDPFPHTPK